MKVLIERYNRDCRYKVRQNTAPAVRAGYGTAGGNQPIVIDMIKIPCDVYNQEVYEDTAPTVTAAGGVRTQADRN